MDLRSGHPYWLLRNGLLFTYPPLRRDERCEVAIIGGGITGAPTAYYLTRAGIDVVLLDKRDAGTGSTAASTALLQYAADTELIDLIARVGQDHAVRSYQAGVEAIDKIETLIATLGDDCGFERRPSLYLAAAKNQVAKLRQEYEARRRFGFPVEYWDAADLAKQMPFPAHAAIWSTGDAQVDAYRLTHFLLQQAGRQGLRAYDRTAVTVVEPTKAGVRLTVDHGSKVVARRVVFAAGYEAHQYLTRKVGALHSTFAAVSEPLQPFPQWPERCLIWETSRPYTYLRTTPDDRVIIGGGDEPFATVHRQEGLQRRKTRLLQRRFSKMFHRELEVAYAWAGTFAETKDGLAYIGTTAEWPHAVGARVPKDRVPPALFWDTTDPYFYLRIEQLADHDYVIFGGADHKTGQATNTKECFRKLEDMLAGVVPEAETVDHRWSGQVIETNDGLPYIGATAEGQFVATGFSGNGMTFGTLAGMMAADAIAGRKNPWSDLFDPSRKKLKGGAWDYLKENLDYPYYYLRDRLTGSQGQSLRNVKRGEGKVLTLDGQRVAAYRDEQGQIVTRSRSAVCTHMGCLVNWNKADATWDCPCHGSRFKPTGEVLAGPAESPLAEVIPEKKEDPQAAQRSKRKTAASRLSRPKK